MDYSPKYKINSHEVMLIQMTVSSNGESKGRTGVLPVQDYGASREYLTLKEVACRQLAFPQGDLPQHHDPNWG